MVLEGHWPGRVFASDLIMVKHTASYVEAHPDRLKSQLPATPTSRCTSAVNAVTIGESARSSSLSSARSSGASRWWSGWSGPAPAAAGRADLHLGDPGRRGRRHRGACSTPSSPATSRFSTSPTTTAWPPRCCSGSPPCGRTCSGSILLWGLVLAGYLGAVWLQFRDRVTDPLVAWATAIVLRRRRLLLRLDAHRVQPVPDRSSGAMPDRRPRSRPAAAEPHPGRLPPARCCTSAWSASPCRSPSPAPA